MAFEKGVDRYGRDDALQIDRDDTEPVPLGRPGRRRDRILLDRRWYSDSDESSVPPFEKSGGDGLVGELEYPWLREARMTIAGEGHQSVGCRSVRQLSGQCRDLSDCGGYA
ncbi:hypothetical protein ACFC26_22675 [Kitasatospora purpeofusca]|uniref:hypothetical protein n=1 Tax=Kitasatospora purpeofusca TaxID=67352 RepID=UPI0035D828EE